MKKYDNYKDSGIEWIGEIPKHWEVSSIKFLAKIQNGSTPSSSVEEFWNGDINWVTTDDLGKLKVKEITKTKRTITQLGYESCGTSLAPIGSIVLSTRAPIGHIGILNIEACSNQGCKTIIPTKINSTFCYFYFLKSKEILESLGQGSTFKELPTPTLKDFKVVFPNLEEQNQIANYLDHKTTQIDTLISKKQQFITLLQEERIAVINQAVTKGLDPKVKMKDSGIEWLGEIPEHWAVSRIKYVTEKIGSGVTPKGGAEVYETSGIPLLRSQNVHFDGFRLDNVAYITTDIHNSMNNSKVLKGDVLLNITGGSIGRCYFVTDEFEDANVNQHVCIVRPNGFMLTEYLFYILSSEIGQLQIDLCQTGGNREALNFEQLKKFLFALPSIEEQTEIVSKIQKTNKTIDKTVSKSFQEIELLKEYKTALISEVVTGKVDVREEVLN